MKIRFTPLESMDVEHLLLIPQSIQSPIRILSNLDSGSVRRIVDSSRNGVSSQILPSNALDVDELPNRRVVASQQPSRLTLSQVLNHRADVMQIFSSDEEVSSANEDAYIPQLDQINEANREASEYEDGIRNLYEDLYEGEVAEDLADEAQSSSPEHAEEYNEGATSNNGRTFVDDYDVYSSFAIKEDSEIASNY